ncbi:hypothetical protein MTR67_048998 [Solanum verrucosum]|uniref:Uncharacterized protein n=1 Tax=Solanum verrucosum TaxID=315347 RepID=A0AAF0UYY2_SOLVR|nr:hypothetical protein MTR67_048998 [Solanum verrucosum]
MSASLAAFERPRIGTSNTKLQVEFGILLPEWQSLAVYEKMTDIFMVFVTKKASATELETEDSIASSLNASNLALQLEFLGFKFLTGASLQAQNPRPPTEVPFGSVLCHREALRIEKEEDYPLVHNLNSTGDVGPPKEHVESSGVLKALVDQLCKEIGPSFD